MNSQNLTAKNNTMKFGQKGFFASSMVEPQGSGIKGITRKENKPTSVVRPVSSKQPDMKSRREMMKQGKAHSITEPVKPKVNGCFIVRNRYWTHARKFLFFLQAFDCHWYWKYLEL